ncbi:MAG: hypothetical protein HN904_07840 [Victivallales bacterium]|jgi:hypothetical protein|nr:hypothetical protein [Victivallales bacterium]MBT7162675.1 hypothetical protein [Victivallales bacterium]
MTGLSKRLIACALLAATASMCGCRKKEVGPHFAVVRSEVKLRKCGATTHDLHYELDGHFETNGHWVEMTSCVDGEVQWQGASKGSGSFHKGRALEGTRVADGDVDRLRAVKESLQMEPTWAVDFSRQSSFTFLEYTGVDGREYSYAVRLITEAEKVKRTMAP